MKKFFLYGLTVAVFVGLFGFSLNALAADSAADQMESQLGAAAVTAGYNSRPTDIRITIALIIRTALGFVGILFICLTVYAGFLWMTAGGNDEQIGKAKKLLYNSVIGLVITLAAFSISNFAYNLARGKYYEGERWEYQN